MFYSSLIERALRVAALAHAGQTRKGTAIPYLTHLAGTALILARAGMIDEELLAGAILHDCLEDAGLSAREIESDFGETIALLVRDVSEVKRDEAGEKLPWKTRKAEHLARLADCPVESRAIVLADKLHNLGTMLDDLKTDPDVWTRFNAAPAEIFDYHEAVFRLADDEPRLRPLAVDGWELLDCLREYVPHGAKENHE